MISRTWWYELKIGLNWTLLYECEILLLVSNLLSICDLRVEVEKLETYFPKSNLLKRQSKTQQSSVKTTYFTFSMSVDQICETKRSGWLGFYRLDCRYLPFLRSGVVGETSLTLSCPVYQRPIKRELNAN